VAAGCGALLARLQLMKANIREFEPSDEEPVVGLSLRALEPVFAAGEEMLGPELFVRLRGDWRATYWRRGALAPAYDFVEPMPVIGLVLFPPGIGRGHNVAGGWFGHDEKDGVLDRVAGVRAGRGRLGRRPGPAVCSGGPFVFDPGRLFAVFPWPFR
jgi:hypothetical protein